MLCAAIIISSCSSSDPGKEVRGKAELSQADPTTIRATVAALNDFGADLHRAYAANHRGNFVLSPYVIAFSLGMTRAGATGDTVQQIDRVMHIAPDTNIDRGFATLAQVLAARNKEHRSETRKGRVDIVAASSQWAPRGTTFKESYLDVLASSFGTGVRVVDFRSDPDTARAAMNTWASDASRGAVTQLVPRGVLTDQTSLVDASTFTVQAPWELPFLPEQTTPMRFTTDDGRVTAPRTMALAADVGASYARGDKWQAIELPYLGRDLSMVLVMPDPGEFAEFEQKFDSAQIAAIIAALRPSPIDARLPKFQFETSARLDDELRRLGMPIAFEQHSAGFDAMTDNESLTLSASVHQSYIDVSENGSGEQTGAIAVTGRGGPVNPRTVSITLDHPYLALIRDRETGLLLSIARVVDPNG